MKNVDKLKFHYKKLFFEDLDKELMSQVAIAGGCLRDYLAGDEVKDIDVFCANAEAEQKIIDFFEDKGSLINENNSLANFKYKDRWFQVIKGKYFELQGSSFLIDTFDFTICQAMLSTNEKGVIEFQCGEHFFQDLTAKHLRINTITFPLSTLERMQKYIKKGYEACNGTLMSIAKSLKEIDLENPDENTLEFYPDGSARFFGVD